MAFNKNKGVGSAIDVLPLFVLKGDINVPSDFPLPADVKPGWTYFIKSPVTDNDPTRTDTGQSFTPEQDPLVTWNSTNWSDLSGIEVWIDTGGSVQVINPKPVNLQSFGLMDTDVTTPVRLGSAADAAVKTTKKSILGASNENFEKLEVTNGLIKETIALNITSNGSVITASLSAASGAKLSFVFSNGITEVDVSTPLTATLAPGSDTTPIEYFLYILESNPAALVASATGFPDDSTTEHAHVGRVIVQSALTVQADGVLKQHNYTDHIKSTGNVGHLTHINEWIREQVATYSSGVDPTIAGSGTATVTYALSSGVVRQLHEQAFPAFPNPATIYVINDSVTPYKKITNLGAGILTDSAGGSLTNRYYNLVIWGVASKSGSGQSKLFVNLPSGSYATASTAQADANKLTNYTIPTKYKGTGFLIQKILLRNLTDSTFTVVDTDDLRGQYPGSAAGSSTTTATEFPDSAFKVFNNADSTKAVKIDASQISTATTRELVIPDRDLNLATPIFEAAGYVTHPPIVLDTDFIDKKYFVDNLPVEGYEFFTATPGQALFTITVGTPVNPTQVKLYVNGIIAQYGASNDFTISGTAITWTNIRYTMLGGELVQIWFDKASVVAGLQISKQPVEPNNNYSGYRNRSISGTGANTFNFHAPGGMVGAPLSVKFICSPSSGAAGVGKDIDITLTYAEDAELITTNIVADTTSTYDLGTVDVFTYLDLTTFFSGVRAGDTIGLDIDHKGIGGANYYYNLVFEYVGA